ncbi:hypothetical protein L1049_010212 [Liquidambar formosana]|uniref:CBS domain-containing protein n=1 Tax=Liquidambar formosana TaxID=63359 RepID=A0AAP0R1N2_LIQFO
MAVSLLAHEVSDLCLGKPALKSLPVSATVADALTALKRSGENYLSVWSCDHSSRTTRVDFNDCRCVGKVCMVDVVCFLCKDENLPCPSTALQSPVSVLLPKVPGLVTHIEPHSSLLEAIDLILDGAQNLIVPIQSRNARKKLLLHKQSLSSTLHNGREYCWLTQEDVVRFLLNCIGIFSPIAAFSIDSLNIIDTEHILAVHYNDPASSVLPFISQSLMTQTSIAIIDETDKLIGEISPFTLACCDETVTAAIATLSAGELMAYIDCGGPPEDLIRIVKAKLKEKEFRGDFGTNGRGILINIVSVFIFVIFVFHVVGR